jgi:hypothetical protein
MLESRISRALLALGAVVGVLGVAVWAADSSLLNVPDWMVRIAMLKLTLVASLGLLGAGAYLGRHARQRSISDGAARQISEGPARPIAEDPGLTTPQPVDRRRTGFE